MIVVDASVVVEALLDNGPTGHAARVEMDRDPHWLSGDHMAIEVASAVRGQWLGRKVTDARAAEALDALAQLTIETVPTVDLLPRIWQLRSNLTAYDAGYVAAAEVSACPLLTADARIASAGVATCPVRVVGVDR